MPPPSTDATEFISAAGRRLHGRWLHSDLPGTPLVFLHEGLGSIELWRDFPAALATATQHPAFVYSRHGNGWSQPLSGPRTPGYMHDEALESLPEIVTDVIGRSPILVGHSDGASIALIYAGSGHSVAGLVLIAPHVFVEPFGIDRIATVRDEFPASGMADKMAAYHHEPEGTFWGWADVWLSPQFRSWNLEEYLPGIDCPILLIQGEDDEYGTTAQLDVIEREVSAPVQRVLVPGARHSPHLSHPAPVTDAAARFIIDLGT